MLPSTIVEMVGFPALGQELIFSPEVGNSKKRNFEFSYFYKHNDVSTNSGRHQVNTSHSNSNKVSNKL